MKSVEQILSVLEFLSYADRHWIVEHLPDNVKSVLMNELSSPENSDVANNIERVGTANSTASVDKHVHRNVEDIDPTVAANILANEPVWMIVAILQSTRSTWASRVVQALPMAIRSMVMVAQSDSRPMSAPIVTSLCNTLLRNNATYSTNSMTIAIKPKLRWRQWLDAIWSRSVA